MQKRIAITAITIFFFAQFGKVLNFCFCSLAVYEQTKTLNCDCEKQLTKTTETESNNHIPHNLISHLQSDELFHLNNTAIFTLHYTLFTSTWPISGHESIYQGFGEKIFRPPLQFS